MQSKYNDTKDCSLCKPTLLPANEVTWKLYQLVRYQWIVAGMDGTPIALNYASLGVVFRAYETDIEDEKDVFEKIVFLSALDIAKISKARKAEYDKMKSKNK